MTQIKKILDKQGDEVFIRTSTKAVVDDNGNTAESRLQTMQDEINQKQDGKSAYQIWLDAGNQGSESDFLASLQGNSGYSGAAGELEVINNLYEGGATAALSAEMGKRIVQNLLLLYNSFSNMAFVNSKPNMDFGGFDFNVNTLFTNPDGMSFSDNSQGGIVTYGAIYSGLLSNNEGYSLSNVSVLMAGNGSIAYDPTTGIISCQKVTGDITITATATFDFALIGYASNPVFVLDGKHKGNNTNAWTDLIGGLEFANHGATSESDHWEFDGIDDYMGGWDMQELSFSQSSCTIEVVYYPLNQWGASFNGTVCHFARQRDSTINSIHVAPSINTTPYINGCYVSGTNHVWTRTAHTNSNTVLAMNGDRAIMNGESLTSLGVNHWTGNRQGCYIGTNTNYNKTTATFDKGFFEGNIYAIRIYDRKLSESEILANQRLDNTRFNLNITTIPDGE